MNTDFLDAHDRHLNDADQLFNTQRWANADHLYGMATECGLKQLMIKFGMTLDSKGKPTKIEDATHANRLWDRYDAYRSGHQQGIHYALPPSNPFQNWNVAQRYAHQSHFDENHLLPHQIGANAVSALIKKAKEEGLL